MILHARNTATTSHHVPVYEMPRTSRAIPAISCSSQNVTVAMSSRACHSKTDLATASGTPVTPSLLTAPSA